MHAQHHGTHRHPLILARLELEGEGCQGIRPFTALGTHFDFCALGERTRNGASYLFEQLSMRLTARMQKQVAWKGFRQQQNVLVDPRAAHCAAVVLHPQGPPASAGGFRAWKHAGSAASRDSPVGSEEYG